MENLDQFFKFRCGDMVAFRRAEGDTGSHHTPPLFVAMRHLNECSGSGIQRLYSLIRGESHNTGVPENCLESYVRPPTEDEREALWEKKREEVRALAKAAKEDQASS